MNEQQLLERITINPNVMVGKPVIKGTRIPVELIVRMVAQGIVEAEILAEYPRLTVADIRAALLYAANVVAHEDVFPLVSTAA
jgi:uncharacterized protein (DUF433 family)